MSETLHEARERRRKTRVAVRELKARGRDGAVVTTGAILAATTDAWLAEVAVNLLWGKGLRRIEAWAKKMQEDGCIDMSAEILAKVRELMGEDPGPEASSEC